ncbi:hypothetical protein BSKO_01262 [Bryopsis sp. KO-2023]|nr:hypothetical protein BSKO_01262 [Bryopsis sp. KO-2023]
MYGMLNPFAQEFVPYASSPAQPPDRGRGDCKPGRETKEDARVAVWSEIERRNLVRFPRPVHGRIPNFLGCERACDRLVCTSEFQAATRVKVHPSLNATQLRFEVLRHRKTLLTPPLPGNRFLYYLVDPQNVSEKKYQTAATKRGFNKLGRRLNLAEIPKIDLVVVASVAVTAQGVRVGKGKGYGEVEYGILREIGAVDELTPVATVVHDVQVIETERLPLSAMSKHDLPVDIICTPTQTIRTCSEVPKPTGIYWDVITDEMLQDIQVLHELKANVGENSPNLP